jgi:molybdopterin-containing oxidoreductase family iron-sulfur binding subunit
MQQDNGIWVGTADLTREESFVRNAAQEFSLENIDQTDGNWQTNRRDFLKMLGFGLGAATVAASCEIPMRRAVPYVTAPDAIVPGVANYYASTFINGGDVCPILVKTREGRPIKIEGNALSSLTKGGTSARAQALVLSLYDTKRVKNPARVSDEELSDLSWADLDKEVKAALSKGGVRILMHTSASPSARAALAELTSKYPDTRVVVYDPVSYSGLLDANEAAFGLRAVPSYRFDLAEVIVSFGADFLGTWINPVEHAAAYAEHRRMRKAAKGKMSRHYQVESHMSLTGSNADNRILVKPSEQGAAICALYNEVAALTGGSGIGGPKLNDKAATAMKKVARDLAAAKGRSLVVSSSNNREEQLIVNKINDMLGNLNTTVDFSRSSTNYQGSEKDVLRMVDDMNNGAVNTVILWNNANPLYDLPFAEKFAEAFRKVGVRIACASVPDETVLQCTHVAPVHHNLESWGDAQVREGELSLVQPTIAPLFNTRQAEHSFLEWTDSPNLDRNDPQPYYLYLRRQWLSTAKPNQNKFSGDDAFWEMSLHDGVLSWTPSARTVSISGAVALNASAVSQPSASEIEISFYETVHIGAGQYAHNPWLQEMPDPLLRTVWGNYLSVPVEWDGVNNINGWRDLNDGDIVEVEIEGRKARCTVVRTYGQMLGTVAIALGQGRTAGGCGEGHGVNVNPWLPVQNGIIQYHASNVQVSKKVDAEKLVACVQYHHTMGVRAEGVEEGKVINADEKSLGWKGFQGSLTDRSIIFHANQSEIKTLQADMEKFHDHAAHLNEQTLYPDRSDWYKNGPKWGMHIDLNACIGCGACQVACVSENNVPVVGKNEVARHHEMTWLRIDRYFYGDLENPRVVYQPMMCQHCDNAPCENVCPVNATNHSNEGLNQMAYNRCIGTRYCANNCPYKVRRFNWLDYTTADTWPGNEERVFHVDDKPFYADNLVRMVLNPDVTVRSRGVIEKCSLCVQRIQEGKLVAKRESRPIEDSDVRTACQTACPTGAITFGNVNNPDSAVSKAINADKALNYKVLEEINVRPIVDYTAKIRNSNETLFS